jgi:hypothetical protein
MSIIDHTNLVVVLVAVFLRVFEQKIHFWLKREPRMLKF